MELVNETPVKLWRDADGIAHADIPQVLVWHSPSGFEWGYEGSGPADLALNVLYHFTGDEEFSREYHQEFKRKIVACISSGGGLITSRVMQRWSKEMGL